MKSLVIVESGAKAKKIKGYLDSNFPDQDWTVEACVGHVRDLSDKENAVDPGDWTNLKWEFSSKGKKVMRELRKICKDSDFLYLATDPDREGEAIAWHLLSDFKEKKLIEGKDVKRVTFNEITSSAIKKAIDSPRQIDQDLVDAYLARRILDHLIGFKVSPLLWRHISRAKSAGRVQSPALRILCEKEDQRDLHNPKEYWPFESSFEYLGTSFEAKLSRL
jgi:DNA topoisomerase-1